jgi:hypothetical protein
VAFRTFSAAIGGGLVLGFAATLYAAAVGSLRPPSSIEPDPGTQAVRVSHRHQTVVDCRHVALPPSCTARLRDGDTATMIRFVRTGVDSAALHPASATVRLAFPHQLGSQEQVARLAIGQWLVDWRGAPKLEKLDVRGDAHVEVALSTVSGACVQKGDRCVLVSGVRERHIRITETK